MAQLWTLSYRSSAASHCAPRNERSALTKFAIDRHTDDMALVTITVESAIRDVLTDQAESHGRTLSEHLQVLAEREARNLRFAGLRADIDATDPQLLAEYENETADWDSTAADCLLDDQSQAPAQR